MIYDPLSAKVLGGIESVRILTENYPVMLSSNSIGSMAQTNRASLNLAFDIMKLIGLDPNVIVNDIIEKLCNGSYMFLDTLEEIFKTTLSLNLKGLYSCTTDPFIPDRLLDKFKITEDNYGSGEGITINLPDIDFSNTLKISPRDEKIGSLYYFDNNFKQNDLYKSKDFNTFLWYVVNKGNNMQDIEKFKTTWNNRWTQNFYTKKIYLKYPSDEEKGKLLHGDVVYVIENEKYYYVERDENKAENHLIERNDIFNIINCEFLERDNFDNNILRVKICNSHYGRQNTKKVNKTIFEFNHDFLSSIKIFDMRTFIGRIVCEMTNSLPVEINLTIDNIINKDKIKTIINKILDNEENVIPDCFFSFSNEEYDTLIQDAELKHLGIYKQNGNIQSNVDTEKLKNLTEINSENSTLQENKIIINKTFTDFNIVDNNAQTTNINASFDILYNFIESFGTVLIQSILSPKVLLLLAINHNVSGRGELPRTFEDIIKGNLNLINNCITGLFDELGKILFNIIMDAIKPLINKYGNYLNIEQLNIVNQLLLSIYNSGNSNETVNVTEERKIKNTPNNKC